MDEQTTARLSSPKSDDPPTAPLSNSEMVLGMEMEILHKFLFLFRDHYKKCEKATYFLENRRGIANVPGIANQRDAISHFSTALQMGSTREEQLEQYINAEEHFRRAIFEPYEIAIKARTFQLIDLYEKYKSAVAPVRDRYPLLAEAPAIEDVDSKISQIAVWRDNARDAKGQNAWNATWEKGVEDCVDAFNLADHLYRDLDKFCNIYEQILRDEEREGEIKALKEEIEKLKKQTHKGGDGIES
jgi:hypothetical protein